MACSNTR
jgi:splicing factor 3B subunit 3